MKKIVFAILGLALILSSCKDEKESESKAAELQKFPVSSNYVQGCGSTATGGRATVMTVNGVPLVDGKVLHVTNLNDNGTGSLRWAVEQSGTRTVVFDVAGVIKLKSKLQIKNGNITIAGQTAPGNGICLSGEELSGTGETDDPNTTEGTKTGDLLSIKADNVIVQFLRFRFANTNVDGDAFNCIGRANILIDHCSFSWSTDECASCYDNNKFTMQWCMIYEGVGSSNAKTGTHGYGGIWGGRDVSFHHNLIANQYNRCPRFDHDYVGSARRGPLDFVNNVVYVTKGGTYGAESANNNDASRTINMVNNYYKYSSSASSKGRILNPTTSCGNCTDAMGCSTIVPGKFYIAGNYVEGYSDKTNDNWSAVSPVTEAMKSSSSFTMKFELEKESAESAYENVLAKAGASLSRDATDARIIEQVRNNTGSVKADFSGLDWDTYTGTAKTDTDKDGMPDYWEDAHGLDKNSDKDWYLSTLDEAGVRTNLEMYLYDIVKDLY